MDRGRRMCNSSKSESESHDNDHKKKKKEVITKLCLPDDVMVGILSLVPIKWLFSSARYVCKPWATIIATSRFAEAHLQHARAKPGLYLENFNSESSSYFLDIREDMNGQFERTDLGTPPRMGNLTSTCDGILLLFNRHGLSFVVNPILKCWLRIPSLPSSQSMCHFKACNQSTIVCVPRTAKFKLFFVDHFQKVSSVGWFVFYVLRIGIDNSWKEIARKEAPPKKWPLFWDPVYSGGNDLYWITTEGVIVMDVDREILVGEYPLPIPRLSVCNPPFGTFLWMENRLSCIVHKDKAIYTIYQIYILDIGSRKWTLYHEMGPFDYVAACGHEPENILCVVFRFWINDQIILRATLLPSSKNPLRKRIYFGYNVKTRELTKIDGITEGDFEVWLYTNSLVSLPSIPT